MRLKELFKSEEKKPRYNLNAKIIDIKRETVKENRLKTFRTYVYFDDGYIYTSNKQDMRVHITYTVATMTNRILQDIIDDAIENHRIVCMEEQGNKLVYLCVNCKTCYDPDYILSHTYCKKCRKQIVKTSVTTKEWDIFSDEEKNSLFEKYSLKLVNNNKRMFVCPICHNAYSGNGVNTICDNCGQELKEMKIWVGDWRALSDEEKRIYKLPYIKKLYLCSSCGQAFSSFNSENECSACHGKLVLADISVYDWRKLSDREKEKYKKQIIIKNRYDS